MRLEISPEGIPWREYRLAGLLLWLPFTVVMAIYLEMVWLVSKRFAKTLGLEKVPNNAIIYDWHADVMTNYLTVHLIKKYRQKITFLGSHDTISYIAFGPGSTGAYEVFRYRRGTDRKPVTQIVSFLDSRPNQILGIFTDAGGPYFHVRESLVNLALASSRPLVPYRSFYRPYLKVMGHFLPLPMVKGASVFGDPIYPAELGKIDSVAATQLLENRLNELKAHP